MVLGFEAVVTIPADHVASLVLALALAMAAQNAVLAHIQGFRAGTTFVTAALFSFGQKLALALTGSCARYGWMVDGFVWLALLAGSLAGTIAYAQLALYALAIPAGISGFRAVVAIMPTLAHEPDAA